MATNKKPRKKYQGAKTILKGSGVPPHIIAAFAASAQPLARDEIDNALFAVPTFITNLRNGSLTELQFWNFVENQYLYIRLLEVLTEQKQFSADTATDILVKLEVRQFFDDAVDITTDITETIGARYKQRGRFIATGDELKHYDQLYQRMQSVFGLVNHSHYFEAFKRSEQVLEAAIYKSNKAKRAERETQNAHP